MTITASAPPEVEFTAHNIRLADGTRTKPDEPYGMESHPWFPAAERVLTTVFPGHRKDVRVADLGCLEGGYALVFQQFDDLRPSITESMLGGYYEIDMRGPFVGIRSSN